MPIEAADAMVKAAKVELVGYEKIDPCPWGDPNEPPDLERARQLVQESGKAGMEFLVANMPDADLVSLKAAFLLENLNYGFKPKYSSAQSLISALC